MAVTATVTFPHILKYKGSVLFRVSREKFCMDQHASSNQADGSLCRSFSFAHGKLSGVTGNECRIDDENGSSKHLIPELYYFFLKTIQTTTRYYYIDGTLLLQEEGKYNTTIYTGYT